MDVGQAIRTLRQKQGMTQGQLAEKVYMSSNAISMLEIGKRFPPMGTVERLCKAFGVSIAYFLMTTIEECDFPESKRILYRTSLEPLRDALIEPEE
jgi:transcriptional regulator with XRE-family HTH domain